MDQVNSILQLFRAMSPFEASFWLLIQNLLQFGLCLLCGQVLVRCFEQNRITAKPDKISAKQWALSALCVVLNTVVAIAGWFLWKRGIIQIKFDISWSALIDLAALLLLMDILMYATHRIAHWQILYPFLHKTHHEEERIRPLSLFVLSPLEVFGYGTLWLLVLTFYHASWLGIVSYLLLNASFGTIGHLGVEPFPKWWLSVPILSSITTSTFHAHHHTKASENFGFYTDVWDKLFGTLNKSYKELFQCNSCKHTQR